MKPNEVPANPAKVFGVQADGVSLLVVRAEIPPGSRAKKATFTLKVDDNNSVTSATAGGLFAKWPLAQEVRDSSGIQTIEVDITPLAAKASDPKGSKRGLAVAIYHAR